MCFNEIELNVLKDLSEFERQMQQAGQLGVCRRGGKRNGCTSFQLLQFVQSSCSKTLHLYILQKHVQKYSFTLIHSRMQIFIRLFKYSFSSMVNVISGLQFGALSFGKVIRKFLKDLLGLSPLVILFQFKPKLASLCIVYCRIAGPMSCVYEFPA